MGFKPWTAATVCHVRITLCRCAINFSQRIEPIEYVPAVVTQQLSYACQSDDGKCFVVITLDAVTITSCTPNRGLGRRYLGFCLRSHKASVHPLNRFVLVMMFRNGVAPHCRQKGQRSSGDGNASRLYIGKWGQTDEDPRVSRPYHVLGLLNKK